MSYVKVVILMRGLISLHGGGHDILWRGMKMPVLMKSLPFSMKVALLCMMNAFSNENAHLSTYFMRGSGGLHNRSLVDSVVGSMWISQRPSSGISV